MMGEMMIVYDGGKRTHWSSEQLYMIVGRLDMVNQSAKSPDEVWDISDATAQTIAAMWHGGSETTLLSTMGKVSDTMHIGQFCGEHEYSLLSAEDRLLIDYLESYILARQAPSIEREEAMACGE